MPTQQQINDDLHQITMEKTKWTNRRRMAWLSLVTMLVVTILILFTNLVSESRLTILSDVITWFYFSCVSVIGFYMGVTAWTARK